MLNPSLQYYCETEVIPHYASFDAAHREDHARSVIERSLHLARNYPVNEDMVYAAAAFHDIGLSAGRETHHLESGRIIRSDARLPEWFSREEIEIIAQAAEDHRASAKSEPRSIYGRILAEADRLIVPQTVIRRTVQYGLSHYPDLDREGHWQRTLEHLREKYGYGGYLKLWLPESENAAPLEELRRTIADAEKLRAVFDGIFNDLLHL